MDGIDYRKEARGRHCMVRIKGVCTCNNKTTVLHHVRRTNLKIDILGAWVCFNCHEWLHTQWTLAPDDDNDKDLWDSLERKKDQRNLWEFQGMFETQLKLIGEGKL